MTFVSWMAGIVWVKSVDSLYTSQVNFLVENEFNLFSKDKELI